MEAISFRDYQVNAAKTNHYPEQVMVECLALGLCSEAGEVADKVKKYHRDGLLSKAAISKELGDCLWYVSQLANHFGFNLDEVAFENIEKLKDRLERGKIGGSGDER